MTLPDLDEHEEEDNPHTYTVREAVVEVVKQGTEEGRLTCGVDACIQLLGSCPQEVMLCLLAQSGTGTQDAAVQIQHILIRAFCHESAIDLLHVHDEVKLTQLMLCCLSQPLKPSKGGQEAGTNPHTEEESSAGFGCIMIKYPKHDTSFDEDTVAEYIKHELMTHAEPYVALPD